MKTLDPRMIVLDFYDGPTEGFVYGVRDGGAQFFKVIAWDEEQTRRLFLLGEVAENVYQELLEILARAGQSSLNQVWTPSWRFDDGELEARANKIVEVGRNSFNAANLVALGENLYDSFEVVSPTSIQLTSAKTLAQADRPGDLNDWLALGSSE